jgi:tetratricopeptide (TPR) repeat protein
MPSGAGDKFDYFLSRRGSASAIAREVCEVLAAKGYSVFVQDYDIALGASFVEAMHEAIQASRDLVVLFTRDYQTSAYTRKEFTSFEAQRLQDPEKRRIVVLRCDDVPLAGLLADNVYQDLVGVDDPEERKRRIIAAVEGHSQAIKPPPRPFVGVPPRVAGFTGRAAALDKLDAILIQERPAAVTQSVGRAAVQGLGGVGKTSLAVEYAYRFRGLYAGVWWCPAENRAGLTASLAALGATLAGASQGGDVETAANSALRALAEQRAIWLLVYDNVTSPEEIADLLPAGGAHVLITSRFSDWGGWAEEVALDVLPIEEATAFLQSRTGSSDESGAKILAEALGRLPLALDHAAAFCRSAQMRFSDYAAKAAKLIAAAPPRARRAAYPRSVAATFDLAIDAAVAQCPAAEELMAFFAQCAPERIPMALIEGAVEDELERLEALAALTELSLVKPDPLDEGAQAVSVHRLVQAVARARSEAKGNAQGAAARLIARLAAIYPNDGGATAESWRSCAALSPHLPAAASETTTPEQWSDLLDRVGVFNFELRAYARAASLLHEALAIRERTLGPEHPDVARTLGALARLHHARQEHADARALHERALSIYEKVFGAEHPDTVMGLNSLAGLLQDQGDFAEARPLYERALETCDRGLGADHPHSGLILNNLAFLCLRQDDLAGARPLFERALAIQEKAPLPDPQSATTLDNLAHVLQSQGDSEGARLLAQRSLAIREKAFGPEHPQTSISLVALARLQEAQGDLGGARPLHERALAIREKTLGPEHPATAVSLDNIATLLQAQGDLRGARPLLQRALAIRDKVHGPEHPETATSLDNLAGLLEAQGDLEGARPLYERALAIREKALGPENPATAISLYNVADLRRAQGDFAGALPPSERALAIHEKAFGPEHPDTAITTSLLARVLKGISRTDEAEALFRSAIAIAEAALGPDHPSTQRHKSYYARFLLETGRAADALPLAQSALALLEATAGPDHPWTGEAARVTADIFGALDRSEEAAALRERYGVGGGG